MKIGLFIDIDGVVTNEAINLQYARLLGVERELIKLEALFSEDRITTDEFGERLVKLFRPKGFTQEWAAANIENIRLRVNAEKIFDIFPGTFIVSSGPSYFLRPLAEKFGIPEERVLCSEYKFDEDGLLLRCGSPVSAMAKGDFVKKFAGNYQITIGIGDVPEQDAGFLSVCNIRVLMNQFKRGYLSVNEIEPLLIFLESLKLSIESVDINQEKFNDLEPAKNRLLSISEYDKNVFIMMPLREDPRYKKVISIIKTILEKHGFQGWVADDRQLHDQLWLNVEAYMLSCKYGIAIFTRDEEKGDFPERSLFNPNVSIELGFMLSRGREVLLLKDRALNKLPTDMMGTLYSDFDLEDSENSLPPMLEKWINDRLK